jgi:hypothetical protein
MSAMPTSSEQLVHLDGEHGGGGYTSAIVSEQLVNLDGEHGGGGYMSAMPTSIRTTGTS